MTTEIIVSLITLAGSALGTFAGIFVNTKLTNYRIEQLEKEQKKFNNLIQRTYELERHGAVVDEEIKVANHRLDDLEDLNK